MNSRDPIEALIELIPKATKAPLKIACIGSRRLTEEELNFCESVGRRLVELGFYIGTGNAIGADQAYARGGNSINPSRVVLYLPWETYEQDAIVLGNRIRRPPHESWMEDAAKELHPAWDRVTRGGRALHTRNIAIVHGAPLCFAWPKPGGRTQGSRMGMQYAEKQNIPLLELSKPYVREQVAKVLDIEPHKRSLQTQLSV